MSGLLLPMVLSTGLGVFLGCSDREHRNPLDPETRTFEFSVSPLEAIAGNGQVTLRWDYERFDDLEGVQLYRREDTHPFQLHQASPLGVVELSFVDSMLVNEITYEYQLALLVKGAGELFVGNGRPAAIGSDVQRATPGEEFAWVGDPASGLVWRISPDARGALFAQGRFSSIRALDVDHQDGSCWLSAGHSGIFRIDAGGEVSLLNTTIDQPGALALDSAGGIGWVTDRSTQDVFWFSLDRGNNEEPLVVHAVDARFGNQVDLAPTVEGCWIVDRTASRVLYYRSLDRSRLEWSDLEEPTGIAVAGDRAAWLLMGGGSRLVRIEREEGVSQVSLATPAMDLDVDRQTGNCWVVGGSVVAAFAPDGELVFRREIGGGIVGVAVDPLHQRVWVVSNNTLWKLSMQGEILSRLSGFTGARQIRVHPRHIERN